MTITGCLKEEKDVPGRSANTAARTGTDQDFILTNVKMGQGSATSAMGLAPMYEVKGIDELAADLQAKGYPIGEPHPALQGGRIVSVHHSGAFGVPLAFIDFTGSPGPPTRDI